MTLVMPNYVAGQWSVDMSNLCHLTCLITYAASPILLCHWSLTMSMVMSNYVNDPPLIRSLSMYNYSMSMVISNYDNDYS
jgi:hypothetical protein